MIICPNCNHQNPEGSVQCENCYTPLPSTHPCPNCGALVQADATFCGQCGFNLQGQESNAVEANNNFLEDNEYSFEEVKLNAVNDDPFQSPWDVDDEEESLPEIKTETTAPPMSPFEDTEEQPFSFEQVETTAPPMSPFEDTEEELFSIEQVETSTPPMSPFEDTEEELFSAEQVETSTPPMSPFEDTEEEPFSTEQVETSTPPMFPFEDTEEELQPIEELSDSTEESEDLEMWISSVKEETSQAEEETEIEEIPELSANEDWNTTAQVAAIQQEEISEMAMPQVDISEPDIVREAEIPEAEIIESNSVEPPTEIPVMANIPARDPLTTDASTRLQLQRALLFHTQTGSTIEIPPSLAVIRIGKQNNQVPPDIDVSGFPNSEIVSRVHADIRVEGDTYFIEDRGSSNGTYINNSPLLAGNRHRLRAGDRISLGKGDLVTFLFQLN